MHYNEQVGTTPRPQHLDPLVLHIPRSYPFSSIPYVPYHTNYDAQELIISPFLQKRLYK